MNCDTARVLLELARNAADLESADRQELERHLEQCADCRGRAEQSQRIDAWLGPAMGAVAIPIGLRERILSRLANERNAYYRGWLLRGAVAAAVLAATFTGMYWLVWGGRATDVQIDPIALVNRHSGPLPKHVDDIAPWIRAQGVNFHDVPSRFRHNWHFANVRLIHAEIVHENGIAIPTLVYQTNDHKSEAVVMFLPRGKFPLDRLPGPEQAGGTYGQATALGAADGDAYVALVVIRKGHGEPSDFLTGPGVPT